MKCLSTKALAATASLAIGLMVGGAASAETVIFADDFNGDTTDLNGASPDVGVQSWIASPMFDRDGNVNATNAGPGSATLAFTPVNGLIYTAEATVTALGPSTGAWVGFGFADGQSTDTANNNRFLNDPATAGPGATIGRAWMFARGNNNNPVAGMDGTGDTTIWDGFPTNASDVVQSPANVDFRIVLDTTGGSGNWTVTWYAKDTSAPTYTLVRAETGLVTEDITSIGFASAGDTINGQITNFSLTSVPEPGSLALLGLGGLLIARRRRG